MICKKFTYKSRQARLLHKGKPAGIKDDNGIKDNNGIKDDNGIKEDKWR